MTTYVTDLYQRAARIMGSRVGTVGTVTASGSNWTVVLNGLINTTGDDTFYAGDRLIFIHSNHTTEQAFITTWADSTGLATVLKSTATPVTNDTYILVHREDYTLSEFQYAMGKALEQTPRTYRQVIPLTPLLTDYPLSQCDWLTGDGDIDAVSRSDSPLMLHNEDFGLWQNGTAAAPDGFTLEGTNAAVARVTGGVRSAYAARLTVGSGGTARLTQKIPEPLSQWITRRTFPVYIQMRGGMWGVSTAATVRTFIRYVESASGSPVTTYAYSSYMTGTGAPEFPTLSLTPTATQDQYEWGVEITGAGNFVDVSWAGLAQSTLDFNSLFQIKDSGSQAIAYKEYPVHYRQANVGGLPTVKLMTYPATWGQLLVYSRRKFPAYSSDADAFDDQYARVLTAGLLVFLTEARKPDQSRERLDAIRIEQQRIWTRMANNVVDLPVVLPFVRQEILGA